MELTLERLMEVLNYDFETGQFTWKISSGKAKVGKIAGTIDKWQGRRVIIIDGRKYKAHRLAWLYVHGKWPEGFIDHRDGNPDNNSINNLRDCTAAENAQNQAPNGNGSSGYLGVTRDRGKWKAAICVNGKTTNLGRYEDPLVAHEAYLKAKASLHQFNPEVRQ